MRVLICCFCAAKSMGQFYTGFGTTWLITERQLMSVTVATVAPNGAFLYMQLVRYFTLLLSNAAMLLFVETLQEPMTI